MKTKIIFGLLLIIGFYSCNGFDSYKIKQCLEKKYPKAISITASLDVPYIFVVVDKDSTIWIVNNNSAFHADKFRPDSVFSFKKCKR